MVNLDLPQYQHERTNLGFLPEAPGFELAMNLDSMI